MTQQWNDPEEDDLGDNQNEGGRTRGMPLRMRQMRVEAQVQAADAQKLIARATARSARYMLIAAVASGVSSIATLIAVLYGMYVLLPRVPH